MLYKDVGFMAGQYTYLIDRKLCLLEKTYRQKIIAVDVYSSEDPYSEVLVKGLNSCFSTNSYRLYLDDFWITAGGDQKIFTEEGVKPVSELSSKDIIYRYLEKGDLIKSSVNRVDKLKVLVKLHTIRGFDDNGLFINSVCFIN